MLRPIAPCSVCAACGESLGESDVCLACLLRAGLDDEEHLPATHFGDFEIEREDTGALAELGRGAMGVTYRAHDTVLNRPVALKVIQTANSQPVRERFLREARTAAGLRHPNIAAVFQFGASSDGERCYCAMELVEGETLEALVRRQGPLSPDLVLEIGIQVTRALIAAAERGLVHRDLKPGNIMLHGGEGATPAAVKMIDFGLAKALSAAGEMELTHGGFVGTPAFASPEQFAHGAIDARTDIYALGVTMWYALTGRLPFAGTTIDEIRNRQARQAPPVEHLQARAVPRSLIEILRTCLAHNPAERPASARDLMASLETCRALLETRGEIRRRRNLILTSSGALLFVLVLAVGWFGTQRRAGERAVPEKSIAVLPFKPLVPAQRDQVLEMGMADTLITKLSSSGEIIVPSFASVRPFEGLEQDARAAGRRLGVHAVLEGNVHKADGRLRVSVRLIRVDSGASLWSKTFDEKFTDVFVVQDGIAAKVAEALALRLTSAQEKRMTRRYTANVAAYESYLTGRFHWNKLIPPEVFKSIGFFQQAIQLDPEYALAHFGLAEAYMVLAMTSDMPANEVFPKAKAAATKALQIDESLGEVCGTLAMVHMWFDWDWAAGEREARRAIELNPNIAAGYRSLSHVHSNLGRHEEAIAEAARARELDPTSLIINAREGATYFAARRYREARQRLQKTLELDPNFWVALLFLGHTELEEGRFPEALAALTRAKETSRGNSQVISILGCTWAAAGDQEKARGVLEELRSLSAQRYVPSSNLAALHLALGEKDQAISYLEKALGERDTRLTFLTIDPKWDALRGDPRFVSIVERVGLR